MTFCYFVDISCTITISIPYIRTFLTSYNDYKLFKRINDVIIKWKYINLLLIMITFMLYQIMVIKKILKITK